MPVAVVDAQQPVQGLSLLGGGRGPRRTLLPFASLTSLHWTPDPEVIHPGAMSGSPRRRRPGRPQGRAPASPGLIEAIAVLHGLAASRPGSGMAERRRLQRLSLAQRLLDPLPPALLLPEARRERFWQLLRWGGVGLLLARLLSP